LNPKPALVKLAAVSLYTGGDDSAKFKLVSI